MQINKAIPPCRWGIPQSNGGQHRNNTKNILHKPIDN